MPGIRSYLKSCQDSRRPFCCRDFEIAPRSLWESQQESRRQSWLSARILASFWPPRFWDLAEILVRISARISVRFWDLAEIFSRSHWESRQVFGCQDFEISPISVKILQGKYLHAYVLYLILVQGQVRNHYLSGCLELLRGFNKIWSRHLVREE